MLGLSIWHAVESGINGSSIPLKLQSALQTIDTSTLDALLHPTFDRDASFVTLVTGVNASPGAANH